MTASREGRDVFAAVGVGVLAVVCCASPVLISAGALAGVGALLHSGWLIGAAALVAATTVAIVLWRRRRGVADACGSPDALRAPDRLSHEQVKETRR